MVRIAVIDRERCRPQDCGYLCMKVCPLMKTKVEVFSIREVDKKPIINENLCIGCGICVKKCPFNAIYIVNLPDELEKNKTFQYGPNTFRLYGLPIPKKGSVVGVLGPNGIGKSTALKILAGIIKPNFGDYNKEWVPKDIIQRFKGTELHQYFENLYERRIKVSYKPQDLLLFRKLYGKMRVIDVLKKVSSDDKKIENYIEKFGLKNIKERLIENLSGGELQKVLIAASLMKDFDIIFLDEPTAFLDIKERLRFAKIVNNTIDETKMAILIEHDIAILDYLSEFVYILYGKPKVYGVVSNRKSTRQGINEYLKGYLRSENVRIRERSIIFEIKAPTREKYKEKVVEWEDIEKKFPGFKLEMESGYIGKTEIVGVLGPNGIGKSTALKILAGIIKPDKGNISKDIEISYKPQYIEGKDITVREFLREANKEYGKKEYMLDILSPLGVDQLLDRKLSSLSGGELQTVYIARTLIKDCDLYVLDEPSAFLDVEQRITLAKILKDYVKSKEKAAIVVDHDIMFIDYISDSLIVFTGIPGRHGKAVGPLSMRDGMNLFLKDLGITFRRDPETKRPRINKEGSYLDRIQKERGEYYYFNE